MEQWRKDARKEPIIIDIDSLVPADHLLRKIEKVMDYEWLYERLKGAALRQRPFMCIWNYISYTPMMMMPTMVVAIQA